MKKLGLFIGMAAFLAAGMLFWGCDKMGRDDFMPPGQEKKLASEFEFVMSENGDNGGGDCEVDCIEIDGPYVKKTYVHVFDADPTDLKEVYVDVYNTSTELIYYVYTEGTTFKYLLLDGVEVVTDKEISTYEHTVLLGEFDEDWFACDNHELKIEVYRQNKRGKGAGQYAKFETYYELVGVCQGCEIRTESAWADGRRYIENGNWATYTEFVDGAKVAIFAGKDILVGYVTLSMVSAVDIYNEPTDETFQDLNFELINGWTLEDVNENVKIEGYDEAPLSGNPAPGQFELYKETLGGLDSWGISFGVEKHWKYFGIHLDVEICE